MKKPEFTKTEYLLPIYLENFFSNSIVSSPFVSLLPFNIHLLKFDNSFFYYIKSCTKSILKKLQKYSLLKGNSFVNSSNESKNVQSKKLLKDYISERFSPYNQNEIDALIFQISNFYRVD